MKPINLNLKQAQTVDLSKQTTFKETRNESTKLANQNRTKQESISKKSSTINQQQSSNQLNSITKKSNDAKQLNQKLNDNLNKTSRNSPSKTTNQLKKPKVPFELKPSNPSKVEFPKYSKENQNLRLLNQVDETRKELLNSKINKSNEKNDRITDRSNLKNIDKSIKLTNQSSKVPITNQTTSKVSANKTTNKLSLTATNQTTNKTVLIDKNLDENKLSANTSLANKQQQEPKLSDEKAPSRLIDFYLKNLPDQFNYLDDSDVVIDLNFIKKTNQPNNQRTINNLVAGKQKPKEDTNLKDKANETQQANSDNLTDFSSQFLKSQKESLEIEDLIDFKITNEDEKSKVIDVINKFMKSLIDFKKSTYPNKYADNLSNYLKEN